MTFGVSKIQKTSGIPYIRKLILISLGSLLLIVNLASGQQPKETKRIFILFTVQKGMPGQILVEEGMRVSLENSTDFQFEYFFEYMDRYRFTDASYKKNLLDLYRTKYADKKIDLFLPNGYHALEFAVAHGDEIFPQTPVVFSTVLETQLKRLKLNSKFTGSLIQIDYRGLLLTALNNHPDTRHVAIIAGASKTGRMIDAQIRPAYAPYANKYDFIYLGHLPMSDMLDRLSKLPKHTVVLYFYLSKDGRGEAFKPWKVVITFSETANAPVYGMADTYLGKGIVGGALLSLKAVGRKAGEIGLRILKGENPADIPISAEGTILNMFDWRQLKRWGINESDLPQGSIVRYREWSFWDLYRWYIIGGIFLFLFQGVVISSLVVQRKKGKQTEKALQQSKEFNRSVLMSLQDHLAVLDREGNILDVNESWMQFAHENDATSLDRIGRGVNYLEVCRQSSDMGDTTARTAMDAIRSVLEGSLERFEIEYACDSPTERRWFHMKALPFRGRKGGIIVAHSDITTRKLAEEKARKRREELIHVGRITTMGEIAASIAHELNQPLTGILSSAQAAEMLLKQGDRNGTEIEEILTGIIADSKRSGDILRNLRDLFSKQKAEFALMGVNTIVKETLRILHSEFVIHDLTIHQDLSNTLPDVMGNKIQLQQVLVNLINNAEQAMEHSATANRSISIVTSRGNESEVQVQVEDTRPGIDPEQLEGIFEPLTTLKSGGFGMGLSISRSIVQAHGGRIWAENRPAGGARISFTLPALENKS